MMHRKDYEKAAGLVRKKFRKPGNEQHKVVTEVFVEFFQDDNPRFDEEKFRFACNREVK